LDTSHNHNDLVALGLFSVVLNRRLVCSCGKSVAIGSAARLSQLNCELSLSLLAMELREFIPMRLAQSQSRTLSESASERGQRYA
jgi:hypothetical protein